MLDYTRSLERLEKTLGEHFLHSPYILGEFGASLACKVDPFYYLAIQPGFIKYVSRWAAMHPESAEAALVRTGNMLSDKGRTRSTVTLRVYEEGRAAILTVNACFVLASFIDRAVAMHGGLPGGLPVSRLRILEDDRDKTAFLFEGKTPLQSFAFGKP